MKKVGVFFALFMSLLATVPVYAGQYLMPFAPYYSQCGQDKYLNEKCFRNKRGGVFVDIGAHDGISYSNTYYFEKVLGWRGICIEPQPDIFKKLIQNRTAICIQGAISNFTGTAPFVKISGAPEMLSGLQGSYDPRHLDRIGKELAQHGGTQEVIMVDVFRLEDILKAHGLTKIDFLSLDTEGSEKEILFSIDFNAVHIAYIVVENNYKDSAIKNYLKKFGYQFVTKIGSDDLFKKKTKYDQP